MNTSWSSRLMAGAGMAAALVFSASSIHAAETQSPKIQSTNSEFAKGFPKQYDSWKKTKDGPIVDMLAEDPRLVVLWAGYGFSKDYNAPRGHMNTITDIRNTLRTGGPTSDKDGPMPMACWSCKSTDVPRLMEEEGYLNYFKGKWARAGAEIVNPIGCVDCHDADSPEMDRSISRPYAHNALTAINVDYGKVTEKDKQTLSCTQCHVEYYFDSNTKEVILPWAKGTKVEDIEAYYDEIEFKDWTHKISKAPMLKAQHPGYEMWKEGVHGKNNVSCTDCHSPSVKKKGVTFTDHQIRSPLDNMKNTCKTCHTQKEDYLLDMVASNKAKVTETKLRAEDSLVKAHLEAAAAWKAGATKAEMKPVLTLIRHSQWRWDFSIASHGSFFHAPEETLRILGTSIEKSGLARVELARILAKHGVTESIPVPDLSTKEKAQMFIGLDMDKLNAEKQEFLKTLVPQWDAEAKANKRF
ncbi:ammonia-forming cytochrome c nitrite reductase subunit c552 [Endozoicomonas sp. (ex Bugula neritina AB1)]|nr:ammonia-forming cytochrome c nitrite reductase subunit c552 [Endozoicomonas sp. (ex Bugula neritina AB1)]